MVSEVPVYRFIVMNLIVMDELQPFGCFFIQWIVVFFCFFFGLQGEAHQCRSGKDTAMFSTKMHPYLLSRRQSLETHCLAQRLQVLSLRIELAFCAG